MPVTKHYTNPILSENLKFNSLKISFDNDLIIGKSFFNKKTNSDINNIKHTILFYMKQSNNTSVIK
jgi:hypothetical protein